MKSAFKWLVPTVLVCLAIFGSVTQAKEQIVFAYMGNAQEAAAYEQVIAEFNRQQSDIEVIGRHIVGDYFDLLIVQIAGGVAPDIFQIYTEEFAPVQKSGWLLNLTPCAGRGSTLVTFLRVCLIAYYEGGLYALPATSQYASCSIIGTFTKCQGSLSPARTRLGTIPEQP